MKSRFLKEKYEYDGQTENFNVSEYIQAIFVIPDVCAFVSINGDTAAAMYPIRGKRRVFNLPNNLKIDYSPGCVSVCLVRTKYSHGKLLAKASELVIRVTSTRYQTVVLRRMALQMEDDV